MPYLENQHIESYPKRERKIDWVALSFFLIFILSFTVVYQQITTRERVKALEVEVSFMKECMSNLHNVMWHRDDQTIVAAVDCPSVKGKD